MNAEDAKKIIAHLEGNPESEFPTPVTPNVFADGVTGHAPLGPTIRFFLYRNDPNMFGRGGFKPNPFAQSGNAHSWICPNCGTFRTRHQETNSRECGDAGGVRQNACGHTTSKSFRRRDEKWVKRREYFRCLPSGRRAASQPQLAACRGVQREFNQFRQ